MKAMAEAIGERLGIPARSLAPEEVADYFGPFAMFAGMDNYASSAITRETLGWAPKERGIVEDLRECEPDAPV